MTQGHDFTNPTVAQRRAAYDTDNKEKVSGLEN